MEAQYSTIASILAAACPNGFDRAWIDAKLNDGHVRAEYWYEKGGETGQPKIASVDSFRIASAFQDVRENWPGERPTAAIFTLKPNGEFKLDASYG